MSPPIARLSLLGLMMGLIPGCGDAPPPPVEPPVLPAAAGSPVGKNVPIRKSGAPNIPNKAGRVPR